MKVDISFDLDVNDLDEDAIDDLMVYLTYDMRVSKRLVAGTWKCNYTAPNIPRAEEAWNE